MHCYLPLNNPVLVGKINKHKSIQFIVLHSNFKQSVAFSNPLNFEPTHIIGALAQLGHTWPINPLMADWSRFYTCKFLMALFT